jgi:D-alanine-D-alanine ligase-like ATP-grasp enzyme
MNLPQTKNVSDLFLAKQGYQIDTIPDDGKKIYISNVINMHNGARISRIDINTIPKINQKMFIETNRALNITCSGIDFLSEDITVDYNINNGKVLEVNGTPDTEIHTKIKFNDGDTFWNKVSKQIF